MKKQLLLLVLFMGLFAAASYAQDKKMFAGVNLGFHSNDAESAFNLGPRFGYWLNDNAAIVGGVNFGSFTVKGATDVTTTSFGIDAHYRWGWHQGDNTFFYLAPGFSYGSVKEENEEASTALVIDLTPGVSYMMGDSWSINAEIGLLRYTSNAAHGGTAVTQFSVGTSMDALSCGLWYHF